MHVFEILAQPIRRRLVETLASGAHYSGDLVADVTHEFGVSRAAAAHHLRLLLEHGAVDVEDDWPYRMYQLEDSLLDELEAELARLRDRTERSVGRRIGGRLRNDPLKSFVAHPSRRGLRGSGLDPDDPWRRAMLDA